ncbi:BnaA09g14470D [Brassica napus]|uniref:BnaA09g14470D protein n=1 Tax=Brassica napus TaxID=3708 RepID=A0A078I2P5_BRANA|nr:BnaA09g14470D [Brassica napus]
MHGCGVYEVNERILYGRFYFGELLEEEHGCTVDICALHSGLAEVAAAKARMFVNKPDGMVREERGPYGDPQHAYFYEEDDVWMAPGFINQFYEVGHLSYQAFF